MEGVEDEGSMEEFVAYLVGDGGYSRNECPDHCPVRADEHAHLHSPGNPASIGLPPVDFILWADGTSTRSDITRGPDCISEVDRYTVVLVSRNNRRSPECPAP